MNTPQAKTTTVVNQKGGVGKTTTVVHLGGALAALGRRVLVVDMDPQGHLTTALRIDHEIQEEGLGAALLGKHGSGNLRDLIIPHSEYGDGRLDLVPTAYDTFTLGADLYQVRGRERRLVRALGGIAADYDHILIDCPPALDPLTDNALVAADGVVIPAQVEDSTIRALELLFSQMDIINEEIRERPVTRHGLVVSMLERGAGNLPKSNIGKSVLASLEKLPYPILATIPRGAVVAETWRMCQTLEQYAPESEHAGEFRKLAKALDAAA